MNNTDHYISQIREEVFRTSSIAFGLLIENNHEHTLNQDRNAVVIEDYFNNKFFGCYYAKELRDFLRSKPDNVYKTLDDLIMAIDFLTYIEED